MPKYLPERYQNPLLKTDEGYQETEELLYNLIKEIKGVYGLAYKEMLKKSKKYLEWFKKADDIKRKQYEKQEITEEDYKNWRRTYMFQGRRTYGMLETLSDDLVNADNIAASLINGYIPEVYAINGNYTEYKISKDLDMNIAFTLYDEQTVERLMTEKPDLLPKAKVNIPKDKQWNKQHITSAITQGIIQGENIDQIAKRLASVTDMNQNSAIRNARTMTTSAQNGGRQDGALRAKAMGISLQKMWLACLDGRTRDSHRELDGEKQEVEDKFSNGLMFPADPRGAAGEVYNCRCTYTTVVKGSKLDASDLSERYSKLGDVSYSEWKKGKQKEQNSTSSDSKNATKALSEAKIHNLSLDFDNKNAIIKVTENAVGTPVKIVKHTDIYGEPNSITQKTGKKGGTDRNYMDSNGRQYKQITNNDHGNPKLHPFGNHGEHAHDYIYDKKGNLIGRPKRELTDDERKENSDIL